MNRPHLIGPHTVFSGTLRHSNRKIECYVNDLNWFLQGGASQLVSVWVDGRYEAYRVADIDWSAVKPAT